MFRPADKMEEDTEMSEEELSSWPDLEPELLSTISACLKKHDQGTMRLVCKAWKTAVDDGLQNLTVVRPPFNILPFIIVLPAHVFLIILTKTSRTLSKTYYFPQNSKQGKFCILSRGLKL